MSGWLTPDDSGYMALGFDEYMNADVAVWSASGKREAVVTEASEWVLEAVELDGARKVLVYYMTDDGRIEGPDVEIQTRGKERAA